MSTILVDADACPRFCLDTARRLGGRWGFRVVTVASVAHRIESNEHVEVDSEPGAADNAVFGMVSPGDIVITADWGLASLVLGRGARAISPRGRVYREAAMDLMLEERHVKARFRRAGGRTRGPAPRTRDDDERFARALEELLRSGADRGPGT